MRQLTAKQKSIVKDWVKKKHNAMKDDKYGLYGVSFPSRIVRE